MERFRDYLVGERGLSRASAESYAHSLGKLSSWMRQEGLTAEQLTYRHLLLYVKRLLLRGESKKLINQGLTAVRHYFSFLIHQGAADYNPASSLYVRGEVRRLPHGLLEREELDRLYRAYGGSGRNKVLVGVLVFQGLSVGELQRLEPPHVDLERRLLHVPATCRSNRRTLRLEECQLAPLRQYLAEYSHEGLFVSSKGNRDLTNVLGSLMERLRRILPAVRSASQLRMSVISCWLVGLDVRVVQHMAGHRHVSSTERYRQDRVRALQQDVASFHPLE